MHRDRLRDLARLAVALGVAAAGPAAAQGGGGSAAAFPDDALHGRWESEGGCETWPASKPGERPSHFHRAYHFAPDGTWRMVRTSHGDPSCRSPLLTLRLAGTYSLGPRSQSVADTHEATLSFDLIHATPRHPAALPLLAGCGAEDWKVGLEKDVGGTGCPGLTFKPLAACSVDHDIVQLRDGVLRPGVRPEQPGGMCTPEGRPTALQPTGVKKTS